MEIGGQGGGEGEEEGRVIFFIESIGEGIMLKRLYLFKFSSCPQILSLFQKRK